jgi:hypothetical protein
MYHSLDQVQRGLLKNATEGIANKTLIIPFSILLLGACVLPLLTTLWTLYHLLQSNQFSPLSILTLSILILATILGWAPRWMTKQAFHQSTLGALLHPLAVAWFVTLQWIALIRKSLHIQTPWRGRIETNP